MKKKVIIHIEDLEGSQERLFQYHFRTFCVEHIEVCEDTTSILSVGELRIDVLQRRVQRSGSPVELTPMEFDILCLLARHPGRVFSSRQIYETVMPDTADGSWTGIGNMIYKLRRKIGAETIKTVRVCGYYLATAEGK